MNGAGYNNYAEACIDAHYPVSSDNLSGGFNVLVANSVGSFGIQLGTKEGSAWVDVKFNGNFSDDRAAAVEATIVNPQLIKYSKAIGRTAVIDTLYLDIDDSFTIGRGKYPELGQYVSGRHARLKVGREPRQARTNLEVLDLHSTNGTILCTKRFSEEEQDWDTASPFEQYSSEPGDSQDSLTEFIDRYSAGFPNLSPTDIQTCKLLCDDLRNRFANDRKNMERQFNMWIHPDRNRSVDGRIAHSMYLLVKQELEF